VLLRLGVLRHDGDRDIVVECYGINNERDR
jgi:hypothetical protein